MDTPLVSLDVISDPICPWCYIGKARLYAALAAHGSNPFDIFWRPFQLNPEMPPGGMDRKTYLEAKFGAERAVAFYAQIAEAAADSGLRVDFDCIDRTPNTIDAHRLIRWARAHGAQDQMTDALFEAYFRDGLDLSDREVLAGTAAAAGMDADSVRARLQSDEDVDAVRAEDTQARDMGVNGVPCFIVGGTYVVNGAQPPELWTRVLEDIAKQQKNGSAAT